MLAGEICNGVGLLGFVVFLAALLTVLRRADVQTVHCVVLVAGSVFVALGYVSTAAETALVHLAVTEDLTAIRVLFELQARIPVVFAAAASMASTAIAGGTARRPSRPVAAAGLALAAVFVVGAVLSVVRPAAGEGSPIGPWRRSSVDAHAQYRGSPPPPEPALTGPHGEPSGCRPEIPACRRRLGRGPRAAGDRDNTAAFHAAARE